MYEYGEAGRGMAKGLRQMCGSTFVNFVFSVLCKSSIARAYRQARVMSPRDRAAGRRRRKRRRICFSG